jgi:hypothetical protein
MTITIFLTAILTGLMLVFVAPTILAYIDVNNLTTLQRMRYTTIQMTLLSLEPNASTTLTNDEIAGQIMEYQLNDSRRLSTVEIEKMYADIVKENTTKKTE